MEAWVIRLLVAIATAAIARGGVSVLALDAKVARLLRAAGASPNLTALAWIMSGAVAFVAVIGWEAFHISDRMEAILPLNRPALGSFVFKDMVVSIEQHHSTGKTDIQLSVEIKNTNEFVLKYNALLLGRVNGKLPANPILTFEGYMPPNETRYMLYNKIFDVPAQIVPGSPTYEGYLDYDVTYSGASSGRGTRHTAKRVWFSTFQGAQLQPPGTRIRDEIMVRLTNEIEE